MNLSPDWVSVLIDAGWDTVHWSEIGNPRAPDVEILQRARAEGRTVVTHDLDFGTILAPAHLSGPSVVQVRAHDIMPRGLRGRLVNILRQFEGELEQGALIVVDERRHRVRLLPLEKEPSP